MTAAAPTGGPSGIEREERRAEGGVALVEFALVIPLLLILVLGMVTAGVAFDRAQSLAHGAREASRFGATLPTGSNLPAWLDSVAATARANAVGNVDASEPSRYLCVALVDGSLDQRRVETGAGVTYTAGQCFSDGLTGTRVQVVAGRDVEIDAMVFRHTIGLRKQTVSMFEATP